MFHFKKKRRHGPAFVEIDRIEFTTMGQRLVWYNALRGQVGSAQAQAILSLLFDQQRQQTNAQGRTIRVPSNLARTYSSDINQLLMIENNQIQRKKIYVASLLGQARSGLLKPKLDAATEPTSAYSSIGGTALDDGNQPVEIQKAYDWAARSWQGPGRERLKSVLLDHCVLRRGAPALGHTPALLDDVFTEVVHNPPAFRASNYQTSYPSSIGGRHLLRHVFTMTSNFQWPAQGDTRWYDYALFYLGAVVTVQGFTDGNKRVGRLGYCIVLLKGGVAFKAPTVALENDLYAM